MAYNIAAFATETARAAGLTGWRVTPHRERSGGRIILHDGRYDRAFLDDLIASVDAMNVARKDLLICVPPSDILKEGTGRGSAIAADLRSWGYEVWDGCQTAVRHGDPAGLDAIRIVQYDSMRGLEGWCTLLVGLDTFYAHRLKHPHLTGNDGSSAADVAKRWMLMALTRAAHALAIALDDRASEVAAWMHATAAAMPDGVVRTTSQGYLVSDAARATLPR